jgi:hypothetical protein
MNTEERLNAEERFLPARNGTPPIRPGDIDLSDGLADTFGKSEVETAAELLVEFHQERERGWDFFSLEEIRGFYLRKGLNPNEMLFGLIGPYLDDGGMGCIRNPHPYIIHFGAKLAVTALFVQRIARHKRKKEASA